MEFKIHGIFESVNGEGKESGIPSAFLRLAGCSIGCPYCDTDYGFNAIMRVEPESTDPLREGFFKLVEKYNAACITGGEPYEQADALVLFLSTLRVKFPTAHFNIQTSGYTESLVANTEMYHDFVGRLVSVGSPDITISLSPKGRLLKSDGANYSRALEQYRPIGNFCELKFIGDDFTQDVVESLYELVCPRTVYFQYEWRESQPFTNQRVSMQSYIHRMQPLVTSLRKNNVDCRFAFQIHKFIGVA